MPRVTAAYERARREQIIAAAARCFSRKGFAATSVPEIAAEAQLSVGALYRYFDGKEELFLAVVSERVAVYNDAVFAALSRPGQPIERLHAALRSLQRLLARQSPEDARLLLELWARAHDVPALGEWLRDARQRRIRAIQRVLDEARLANRLRREVHTHDAAAMLIAVADGLAVQRACVPFQRATGNPLVEAERLLASWQPESSEALASACAPRSATPRTA